MRRSNARTRVATAASSSNHNSWLTNPILESSRMTPAIGGLPTSPSRQGSASEGGGFDIGVQAPFPYELAFGGEFYLRAVTPSPSSLPHHPRWWEHRYTHPHLQVPLRLPALVRDKGLAFVRINPGLSAFAENLDAAGESLSELVKFGKGRIPRGNWRDTKIRLMATTGLMMLDAEVQG
ncbi:hypothetical protein Fmac_005728 [Flemingia macrophylla]|uniref:Uncharacterized protein n=1 Tax=Flemingia macrophylla TaxID=520843 RepID=A0ABD1N8J9_9FABA